MNVVLYIPVVNGLGEIYHQLYTAYAALQDIKQMGHNAKLILEMIRNVYYPNELPLDHVFDISHFGDDISFKRLADIDKNLKEIPQTHNQALRIFVEEVTDEMVNYQYIPYNVQYFRSLAERKLEFQKLKIQFLSKEVIDIKDQIVKDKNNISGLCIRIPDIHNNAPIDEILKYDNGAHNQIIDFVKKYCDDSPQDHVFITCNSRIFLQHLQVLHPKIFTHTFTYDFALHSCKDFVFEKYKPNHRQYDNQLIRHTQEIAATMAVFAECKHFQMWCQHISSFMCYGVLHNKHNKQFFVI